MTAPRLLDLFCGAGGAAAGYARAGFEVTGIDVSPQPHYPYEFIQMDALTLLDLLIHGRRIARLDAYLTDFDAIHASPPCQAYSAMSRCRPGLADQYPKLIEPVRDRFTETGLPYVIENVPGAPLKDPVTLCGFMFGRKLYRHRQFETSFPVRQPYHPEHLRAPSRAGHWKPGTIISVAGNCAPIALAREVMDINWTNRAELAEAIPPAYTEYVGGFLHRHLTGGPHE